MFALGFYAGRACCERLNMRSEFFPSYVIPSCKKLWCDNIVLHRSLLPNPPSPSIGICFTSRTRSGPISGMDHYFRQLVLPRELTWLAPAVQFAFDQIVCTRPQTFFLGPELHPPKRFSDHNILSVLTFSIESGVCVKRSFSSPDTFIASTSKRFIAGSMYGCMNLFTNCFWKIMPETLCWYCDGMMMMMMISIKQPRRPLGDGMIYIASSRDSAFPAPLAESHDQQAKPEMPRATRHSRSPALFSRPSPSQLKFRGSRQRPARPFCIALTLFINLPWMSERPEPPLS